VVSAFFAGLAILTLGLWASGYNAPEALAALWNGAFGSWYAFTSATLLRAIPLIIIGLGFALALEGGALNIGAEGQFYAGAIAATWIGLKVTHWPDPLAIGTVLSFATIAGAVWMVVPVWLKLRFGVIEVITTLLLNFVAESLVSLMVQGPLQEATGVFPQSNPLPASARLPLLPGTRLHIGIVLALALSLVLWYVVSKTVWGFRLRAIGAGPRAAEISGRIRSGRMLGVALLWSGALAGLAGGLEVTGVSYALYQNLSPGYGFTAIAVALLARLRPLGVVFTGILFGALEAGAGAMQRDAGIPSVAVYVVEAVVILVIVLADTQLRHLGRRVVIEPAPARV
jgi:simple sugar transport system permease protein